MSGKKGLTHSFFGRAPTAADKLLRSKIIEWRARHWVSQAELAQMLGCSPAVIRLVEVGAVFAMPEFAASIERALSQPPARAMPEPAPVAVPAPSAEVPAKLPPWVHAQLAGLNKRISLIEKEFGIGPFGRGPTEPQPESPLSNGHDVASDLNT